MRQTLKVFSIGMRAVLRDAVMLILIPAPFAIGGLFRLLVPLLNGMLIEQTGFPSRPGIRWWMP